MIFANLLIRRKNGLCFKEVESEFIKDYGKQEGIAKVFCGMGSGVGPYNAITISIEKNKLKTRLPKYYLGFLVIRKYESQT